MATLDELARLHSDLDPPALGHLKRLVGSWGMLSDLCFADLLLFVPVAGGPGTRFLVLGQVRPTTAQTLYRDDLVGSIVEEADRPLVARALRLGEIVEGEIVVAPRHERARIQCIPVRWKGEVLAVMTREAVPSVGRRPGELERVYVETFDRFARMIVRGDFPFGGEEAAEAEEAPRVGDGVLILDAGARVEYASPNAISALHRMGISSNVDGMRLDELGIDETAVRAAYATLFPVTEEIERRTDVIVLLRCIPLLDDGGVNGALVLLRDVTQLRRLDRLLLSKDAAIREVHHRVKNNLQTISSLLRLQARRIKAEEARAALVEAERRIRAIARVHEILSREAVDQVPFDEIVEDLVRVAADTAHSLERSVRFAVEGDAGELPAHIATPLAVVLQEVLQNAVEHGFEAVEDAGIAPPDGTIEVELHNDGESFDVVVRDNGRGLPEGFTIESTDSLGLQIVQRLVTTQLFGEMTMTTDGGTVVRLSVPLHTDEVLE
ncbi:MAG TPA: histidine kinase N-terminal domain-containing protein [Acidimicrobiales bacterium]|nr:histidine kinase N-terminal domain-containing protein [Acidimicrobiales bacterium]